jgi:hypothetical protein
MCKEPVFRLLTALAVIACLGTACSKSAEEGPTQNAPLPVAQNNTHEIAAAPTVAPVAPPPPGAATSSALTTAANTGAPTLANDNSPASYVMANMSAYFVDKNGQFEPTTAQEVVERAVQTYRELRASKHDDSPDWPAFNDLSLLVKYKILRALPPAPQGQKFVYDATTRKVTLAAN